MNAFIEILKIILPATAVFLASYFVVRRFLDNEQKRREHELQKATIGTITPQKIQAYERLVIYLERIHPSNLVVRVNKHGQTSRQFHHDLIQAVKTEYEHNLSQQIFVSYGAWELVKNAKEELVKLINIAATKVPQDAPGNELAMMVLNITANLDKKMPSEIALDFIKKEVSKIF
ncbi:MAG: DUF7935 family protein [Bacteroidia bacterium]